MTIGSFSSTSSSFYPVCGKVDMCHGNGKFIRLHLLLNLVILLPWTSSYAFSLNNPPQSTVAIPHSNLLLNAYKEIYSSILLPPHRFPEEDPVSKMDLVHALECAYHFGKCSFHDIESMQKGTFLLNHFMFFSKKVDLYLLFQS